MNRRSFKQKFWEWFLALKIEKRYSKSEILEIYLNQVYMGENNISGVARAAQYYFGKKIQDINLMECALLAGMIQSPGTYLPTRHPERAKKRANTVLRAMRKHGYINQEEYEKAKNQSLVPSDTSSGINRQIALYPYFSESIRRRFIEGKLKSYDGTPIQLYGQGIDIEATIDTRLQEIGLHALQQGIEEQERVHRQGGGYLWGKPGHSRPNQPEEGHRRLTFRAGEEYDAKITAEFDPESNSVTVTLPYVSTSQEQFTVSIQPETTWLDDFDVLHPDHYIRVKSVQKNGSIALELADNNHVQGGLIAVQPSTGKILALIGGYQYNSKNQYIRAIQSGGFQPGSAFKPLLYATVLASQENQWTCASLLRDEEIEFWTGWTPKNYYDDYYGDVTLRFSLVHSLNAASVWLLDNFQSSRYEGIKTLRAFCSNVFDYPIKDSNLSIALGSSGTTPWDLAQAYSVLANQGHFMRLHMVEKVLQRQHQENVNDQDASPVLYQFQQPFNQQKQLSPQVSYLATYLLRQVVEDGTGKPALELPFYSVGKTGTTDDCIYAWYAGYSRDILCVVYLGYDNPKQSLGVRRTGSRVALPVWMEFMKKAHEVRPDLFGEVKQPKGIVYRDICESSGLLATENCPKQVTLGDKKQMTYGNIKSIPFIEGTEPAYSCIHHGSDRLRPYENSLNRILLRDVIISQNTYNME
ncbi:hypothetical protein GF373_04300 [bacterium]|nr:hypothetical protein [bacterium]